MVSTSPMPRPAEMNHAPLGATPASLQYAFSIWSVPELSPREMNLARPSPSLRNAPMTSRLPRRPSGSSLEPTRMKSLYMTSRRFTPWPSATNFSSAGRACTSTASTSPFLPSSSALPVPTEMTCTLTWCLASKAGSSCLSRPEFSVLVVVDRRMPRARAGGATTSRIASKVARAPRRQVFPGLVMYILAYKLHRHMPVRLE